MYVSAYMSLYTHTHPYTFRYDFLDCIWKLIADAISVKVNCALSKNGVPRKFRHFTTQNKPR